MWRKTLIINIIMNFNLIINILFTFFVILISVFCLLICTCDIKYLFWTPRWYYDFRIKRCSVRLYLPLFVRGLVHLLPYLCLLAYSGVKHIVCCVFVLFFFLLCTLCCQFLWIVHFWLSLWYSLTFICEHALTYEDRS